MTARKVLNVGGNSREIPLPPVYEGWNILLLDIDERGKPDILCDARELEHLAPAEFDSVYCSHNLEHYFRHDVARVLSGFKHVLKDDGFVFIRVPDIAELMRKVVRNSLDIDDDLYDSAAGPIAVHDVIYGFGPEIERSGNDFFAHKTGYSQKSLVSILETAGFSVVFSHCANLEVIAYAFKSAPTEYAAGLLGLTDRVEGGRAVRGRQSISGQPADSLPDPDSTEAGPVATHTRTGSPRRLHIGGRTSCAGWEVLNVTPAFYVDHVGNANDLARFSDNAFFEIYASHVVEHLDYKDELMATLKEWYRVLEPGGRVMISVPDLDVLAELLASKDKLTADERFFVMRVIFGGHADEYDYHLVGLNREFLTQFLHDSGYVNIRRVQEFNLFHDSSSMVFGGCGISLNMIAEKPRRAEAEGDLAYSRALDRQAGSFEDGDERGSEQVREEAMVLRTFDGISIVVPATLRCISTYVLLEQEQWFEREVGFVARWLKKGMNAIDIGANVGVYCLQMARSVGEVGQVFAFEPGSDSRRHLDAGRLENSLENLKILPFALADSEKDGWLQIAASGELNSLSEGAAQSAHSERVRVSTLDILEQEIHWPSIDFVKIDAEGQEARIVAGGRVFFVHHSPLVMYEFNHDQVINKSLRWMFEALGYKTYRLLGDATCLVPVASDDVCDAFELNLFAAKPDRAAGLAEAGLLVETPVVHSLTVEERSVSLQRAMAQPYACAFEFSVEDIENCPFGEAFIAYAAYRNAGLHPARRYAALNAAFEMLAAYCRESETLAGLATLARVALDLGFRAVAVDALGKLIRAGGVEIDQPFYPPCERYEQLSPEGRESPWFVAAAYEQYELSRYHTSCFADDDLARMKWLCESPFTSAAISRRRILQAAKQGQQASELAGYIDFGHRHQNPAYWTAAGLKDIVRLC